MPDSAKIIQRALIACFLLSLSGQVLSDWSADRESWLASWRNGKVVRIDDGTTANSKIADECADKFKQGSSSQRLVTLKYTQTRREHLYQMPLSNEVDLQRGDSVRFKLNECRLGEKL